ncbi:MAG: hypothetical protein K7J46_18840, partial [Bryobacter sp.]|nr:hypothetical protein [Bryobacter sp. CoA8 C33]
MTGLIGPVPAHAENDCAAWRRLEGLTPGARYFHSAEASGIVGTFATLPDPQAFLDRDTPPPAPSTSACRCGRGGPK